MYLSKIRKILDSGIPYQMVGQQKIDLLEIIGNMPPPPGGGGGGGPHVCMVKQPLVLGNVELPD